MPLDCSDKGVTAQTFSTPDGRRTSQCDTSRIQLRTRRDRWSYGVPPLLRPPRRTPLRRVVPLVAPRLEGLPPRRTPFRRTVRTLDEQGWTRSVEKDGPHGYSRKDFHSESSLPRFRTPVVHLVCPRRRWYTPRPPGTDPLPQSHLTTGGRCPDGPCRSPSRRGYTVGWGSGPTDPSVGRDRMGFRTHRPEYGQRPTVRSSWKRRKVLPGQVSPRTGEGDVPLHDLFPPPDTRDGEWGGCPSLCPWTGSLRRRVVGRPSERTEVVLALQVSGQVAVEDCPGPLRSGAVTVVSDTSPSTPLGVGRHSGSRVRGGGDNVGVTQGFRGGCRSQTKRDFWTKLK